MWANIALQGLAHFAQFVFAHLAAKFALSVRFSLVIIGPLAPCSTCHNEDGIWANTPLPRTMEGGQVGERYKHINQSIYLTFSLICFPRYWILPSFDTN